jgi:hypothetical protein
MTVRQTDELTGRLRAAIQQMTGQRESADVQTEVSLA